MLVRQLCKARSMAAMIPEEMLSYQDFAFIMLNPTFGNEEFCSSLIYRKKNCK